MINLKVLRHTFSEKSTIGDMFINGQFFCYTLEDMVREPGVKVDGQTAIPEGHYKVVLDFSNRFQKIMPHILDIPNFEGVRIHPGNTAENTEGCILVGLTKDVDFIGASKAAYEKLMDKLRDKEIKIEIGRKA